MIAMATAAFNKKKNLLVYKFQQDAQVTEFILSENCSTGFGF